MKKYFDIKNLIILITLTILSSIVGYFLLIVAFMLPTNSILNNVRYSFKNGAFNVDSVMFGKGSTMPNVTEKLVLEVAAYPVYNPLKDSLRINYFDEDSIRKVMYENEAPTHIESDNNYGRYWFGVEIFAKPLLMFMTYEQIRNFTFMIMILVLSLLLTKIRKYGNNLMVGVLMTFLFLNPITISITFAEFFSPLISYIAMILVINMKEKKETDIYKYEVLFCMIGVCINYFEMLRFPLITLGLPLCLYLTLNYNDDTKENIITIIKLMASWFTGYALMWGMKWVLYSVVLKENKFLEVFSQIAFRTSSYVEDSTISIPYLFLRVAYASLQFSWPMLLLVCVVYYINNKKLCINKNRIILFIIMLMLPVAFTVVLSNFCFLHTHLAYRNYVIPLFSIYALLVKD